MITKIMHLTQDIQMAVYKGELSERADLLDWLMEREEVMPRLNPRVLAAQRHFLAVNEFAQQLARLAYFEAEPVAAAAEAVSGLSLWLVADPDSERGRQLLLDAVGFQQASKVRSRLAVFLQKASHAMDR